MNDIQRFWRDKVFNLLQWGVALFVLLAGWAVENQNKFNVRGTKDEKIAAIGLIVVTLIYATLLPIGIHRVYTRFLDTGIDDTVLPSGFALWSGIVLSVAAFVVAILMSVL